MTVISDKYKCIFIRIPKTATTSIENAFDLNDPGSVTDYREVPHGHDSWQDVKRMAGDDRWNSYYKFCVLRDPYDWLISTLVDQCGFLLYNQDAKLLKYYIDDYVTKHPKDPDEAVGIKALDTMMVDGFVTVEDVIGFAALRKYWYEPKEHLRQTDWIPSDIDYVIDFANLKPGWEKVKKQTGIDFDIPWDNKSKYTDGIEYKYTLPAHDYATSYFEKDIDYYNKITSS